MNALDEEYVHRMRAFDDLAAARMPANANPLMLKITLGSPFLAERERRLYQAYILKYRPGFQELRIPRGNDVITDTLSMRGYSVLAAQWIPDFVALENKFKELEIAREGARILAALQIWRAAHGAWPEKFKAPAEFTWRAIYLTAPRRRRPAPEATFAVVNLKQPLAGFRRRFQAVRGSQVDSPLYL